MDAETEIENGIRADGPEDLQTLESLIAADEAADAAKSGGDSGRDDKGRFKGSSAKDAQRAGERLTPEQISARDFRKPEAKAGGDADTSATKPADKSTEQAAADAAAAAQQKAETDAAAQEAADAGKSSYRKEIERRERSWQELNKQKEAAKAREDELELREKTLVARERALATRGQAAKLNGYTAEDYDAAAPKFEAQAAVFEQAGNFDEADKQRALAEKAREAAAQLRARNPAGDAVTQSWQKLKSDLPEALNAASPLNRELRALIQTRPDLLGDEAGPYRVAVLAGRKLVAQLEGEKNKLAAEAQQVPGLKQQVEALTAKVRELEQLTSLPGGGGNLNRGGGSGGKSFSTMTLAEQEAAIERELAGV
jgi:hypothetical protein